jgi:mRNA interferase MazF
MVVSQGDVCWADMDEPKGSEAGYRWPVVIVQCDAVNQSRIGTILCVPLTSNTKWATAPGNVLLKKSATGLPRDSVANVSLITALDREQLTARAGKLTGNQLNSIIRGINIILGR